MIHLGDHLAEVARQASPWREVSSLGLLDTAGCHAHCSIPFIRQQSPQAARNQTPEELPKLNVPARSVDGLKTHFLEKEDINI